MSKPMTQKEYRATRGNVCPACRGTDIQTEINNWDSTDGTYLAQEADCLDCGAAWVEVYRFYRYEDLHFTREEDEG